MIKRIFIFVFLCLIFSCQSNQKPAWVGLPPTGPDYFTGIGNSNLRSKSVDYDMAQKKARADLAKSIGVYIQSTSEIYSYSRGDGFKSESYFEKIDETVNRHLELVEVVDSWYSKREGWWFYLRINRSDWFIMVESKQSQLADRVLAIVNQSQDKVQQLDNIIHSFDLINKDPYGENAWFKNDQGNSMQLSRYLTKKLSQSIQNISFSLSDSYQQVVFGQSRKIQYSLDIPQSSGSLPVKVCSSDFKRTYYRTAVSGKSGFFDLALFNLPIGKEELLFLYDNSVVPLDSLTPLILWKMNVDIALLPVSFSVYTNVNNFPTDQLKSSIFSVLPISLDESTEAQTPEIKLEVQLTEQKPVTDGKPWYASAQFSILIRQHPTAHWKTLYTGMTEKVAGPDSSFVYRKLENKMSQFVKQELPHIRNQLNSYLVSE